MEKPGAAPWWDEEDKEAAALWRAKARGIAGRVEQQDVVECYGDSSEGDVNDDSIADDGTATHERGLPSSADTSNSMTSLSAARARSISTRCFRGLEEPSHGAGAGTDAPSIGTVAQPGPGLVSLALPASWRRSSAD